MKIKGEELDLVIKSVLESYSSDVKDMITETAINLSEQGKNTLKKTSPKRTGKYSKGWKVRTKKGNTFVHCTIHNTKYQLTHLLEKGHMNRDGSRTRPITHIAPVEKKIKEEFVNKVENSIKGGL